MDSCSKSKIKFLFQDYTKGLKLVLDDPNPPLNQGMVAFPVRPSALVILLNTNLNLEAWSIHHWNVEHPAAVAQYNDNSGVRIPLWNPERPRTNPINDDEQVVGSYHSPSRLLKYKWPRAKADVAPDQLRSTKSEIPHVSPKCQLRKTLSALF